MFYHGAKCQSLTPPTSLMMGQFGGSDPANKGKSHVVLQSLVISLYVWNLFCKFSIVSGNAAPSTPTKHFSGKVGLKRARNMREKEIHDRTLPHLDHADNPRQTTHAVGVLKAVSLGKQYGGWVSFRSAFSIKVPTFKVVTFLSASQFKSKTPFYSLLLTKKNW